MQLQKYVQGNPKPPQTEEIVLPVENMGIKRKTETAFFEETHTENITPKKKLKVRKRKLRECLGIKWL